MSIGSSGLSGPCKGGGGPRPSHNVSSASLLPSASPLDLQLQELECLQDSWSLVLKTAEACCASLPLQKASRRTRTVRERVRATEAGRGIVRERDGVLLGVEDADILKWEDWGRLVVINIVEGSERKELMGEQKHLLTEDPTSASCQAWK